jgi:hypothetical protein
MMHNDKHNLELLFATTGGLPYNPPSYTCIREFADSFSKLELLAFEQEYFPAAESAWQPEPPYPRIYNKHYRKTILSSLKQTIAKT